MEDSDKHMEVARTILQSLHNGKVLRREEFDRLIECNVALSALDVSDEENFTYYQLLLTTLAHIEPYGRQTKSYLCVQQLIEDFGEVCYEFEETLPNSIQLRV